MQSEQINELATALVKAQAEFGAVPKGSINPFFKSKYASLPDVVAHATPVLTKNGLAVSQFISDGDTLTTYLLHTSGQFIAHTMSLHLVKDDPQAQGSAVTYARRYAYLSACGLVADEDDDANATRGKVVSRPAVSSDHEALKKALSTKFETGDDRKFFIEATLGRSVEGISTLTGEEAKKVLSELNKSQSAQKGN